MPVWSFHRRRALSIWRLEWTREEHQKLDSEETEEEKRGEHLKSQEGRSMGKISIYYTCEGPEIDKL